MNGLLAFTIIMLIWTISDFVSAKTKSLVSSLLVASLLFLVGFKSNILPSDILENSSLLAFGATVVGMIIIHIGTMLSLEDFKKQWRTVIVGVASIFGTTAALLLLSPLVGGFNEAIGAIAGITGGTISVILIQDVAIPLGLTSVAVLPVLIVALQGIIGFPLTSILLRKEAKRIKENGLELRDQEETETVEKKRFSLPKAFQTTAGTLFILGVVMVVAQNISALMNGAVNEFVIALILGVTLKQLGFLKKNVLSGIDSLGIMMIAIMILVFGPLATLSIDDLIALAIPLLMSFAIGVTGGLITAILTGKLLGYSTQISMAISLTSLFGFPGTMILSQEAAKSVGETPQEIQAIEQHILPKMIVAGFSTVTITSVMVVGILAPLIGG